MRTDLVLYVLQCLPRSWNRGAALCASTLGMSVTRCSKPVVHVTRCLVSASGRRSRRLSAGPPGLPARPLVAAQAAQRRSKPYPGHPSLPGVPSIPPRPTGDPDPIARPLLLPVLCPSAGQTNHAKSQPNPILPRTPAVVLLWTFCALQTKMHAAMHSWTSHVLPVDSFRPVNSCAEVVTLTRGACRQHAA